MSGKILMLGGAMAQIPAIKRAKELGFYVITCDYLPNNPGHQFSDEYKNISTIEQEEVLKYAEMEEIDGVIAYASDPSARTCAYISDRLGLSGSSYESVQRLLRKDIFRDFQRKEGFKFPYFNVITDFEELKEIEGKIRFPSIVKPVDSSGSKGVTKVNSNAELQKAFESAISYSHCGRVIIEEYIPSPYCQLHGEGVAANGKLQFIALGDQRFLNAVPIGTSLPSQISNDLMEKVKMEVARLIERSGFNCGGMNIEVRVTEKGEIYIIEIGPRTGGNYVPQLMQLATGEDEVTTVLQMAMGMEYEIGMPKQVKCCFQYIIGSDKNGKFQKIYVDKYIQNKIKKIYVHKQPGDLVDTYQNSNGVVGVALIAFDDSKEMEEDIKNIGNYIQVIVDEERK
ncbi:MAG: ATP-grasp domain-containing protein [Lachnospiraceae bacterium]